ncbi:MAG TPA: hypothetical protein H9722_05225 [Candidatus Mediterraneibacter pullistercoris]|nr:hypothetical protein [Candidatus Mediterraneibacter pullistercoris]
MTKEEGKLKGDSKRRLGRLAGWFMILFLIVVIVPVGAIMFVLSGLWSAVDRALLKFSR